MTNILSIDSLSKSYADKWLFREISFGIQQGEKAALVGVNGTGKSTLLKCIIGEIEADSGRIATAKKSRLFYLPQNPIMPVGKSIQETLFNSNNPISQLIQEYEKVANQSQVEPERLQELMEEMNRQDAWNYENRAQQILQKLEITDLNQSIDQLSGGQIKRVALAQMLLHQPDLLIMDEPTNHLDLNAIEWLESYLKGKSITLLMVTHDRYFLDGVSKYILELDKGNLYQHKGNYTYFLEQKSKREADLNKEVSRAKNLLKKELEWMRRQPKARGTKSKSRIEAFYDLKETANQQVGSAEVEMNVNASRLGNKVIELSNISMHFDELRLIDNFTYTFNKGDKIAIIGKNGSGKSTLLNIISNQITPTQGKVVHGQTLNLGYYAQHVNNLNLNNRMIEEVKEIAEFVTLGNGKEVSVSKLLDMFLFPPSFQHTPIHKLSGGEKRRLQLLKILVQNPNFLILDEPTNDLDIDTLNVLESFLMDYNGCLLMVSHDRYFLDKIVDHLFVFEGQGVVKDFHGNYSDYKEQKELNSTIETPSEKSNKQKPSSQPTKERKKLSYKERLEMEKLEKEIEQLEQALSSLTKQLQTELNYESISQIGEKINQHQEQLDIKTERWIELSELS